MGFDTVNISRIIDMINDDPSISGDIDGFLKRVNDRNQRQVVRSHVEIVDEERMVSIADLNGGECTVEDVKRALSRIAMAPLSEKADATLQAVQAAISNGDAAMIRQALNDAASAATEAAKGL